jgi:hypothetical protein
VDGIAASDLELPLRGIFLGKPYRAKDVVATLNRMAA